MERIIKDTKKLKCKINALAKAGKICAYKREILAKEVRQIDIYEKDKKNYYGSAKRLEVLIEMMYKNIHVNSKP